MKICQIVYLLTQRQKETDGRTGGRTDVVSKQSVLFYLVKMTKTQVLIKYKLGY